MNDSTSPGSESLQARLAYAPQVLQFGTSGRRGDVIHLTQLEIYINARAELEYLLSLPAGEGGIARGDEFYFAYDLRPSSTALMPEERGRGEIAQAIEQAIRDAGMRPANLGPIPTPALTFHALERGRGSMMITGSHIPFDRNGYKTNTAKGELLKKHEAPIDLRVQAVRARLYREPFTQSRFDEQGRFKAGHKDLSPEMSAGREGYLRRYLDFFGHRSLHGKRLLVYEHSAVGRDLIVELLERLGAEVIRAGRSTTFVPIDTENIDEDQLGKIQALADDARAAHGPIGAVVSTDGDSDRPLMLGVEAGRVRFFGGDLLGMIAAEFLRADAVVVPISCNDAVDRGALKECVEPKTRIGSPYVIAGMEKAKLKGKKVICGWEANGGFLCGSNVFKEGTVLKALPTRDAFLPILAVLFAAGERGLPLEALFARLPKRFSRAALLKRFPRDISLRIIERFSPADPSVKEVSFGRVPILLDDKGTALPQTESGWRALEAIRESLGAFFPANAGFDAITRLNYIDGVRIYFSNGDVAHIRPSGNADELRIYAVADTSLRADEIARLGVAEPDGILRQLERSVIIRADAGAAGCGAFPSRGQA